MIAETAERVYTLQSSAVLIPGFLFYVGMEAWSRKTLRLSESFLAEPKENSLELVVNLINLNCNVLVTASAKRQRMQS